MTRPPLDDATYALCLYENGIRTASFLVPPVAGWANISTKGFKYLDATASESGISKIVLKSSVDPKAKALVKGKGDFLPTITPGLDLPVKVQLINSATGVCFESEFDAGDIKKNVAGLFKAKAQ